MLLDSTEFVEFALDYLIVSHPENPPGKFPRFITLYFTVCVAHGFGASVNLNGAAFIFARGVFNSFLN